MSTSQDIKDVIAADSSIMTALTGGLYTFDETGYMGISFTNTPAAYSGPTLLPCAVVKARAEIPTSEIKDMGQKVTSYVQYVEVWLYDVLTTETIEEVIALLYNLLHEEKPFEGVWCTWDSTEHGLEARELSGAMFSKMTFKLQGLK